MITHSPARESRVLRLSVSRNDMTEATPPTRRLTLPSTIALSVTQGYKMIPIENVLHCHAENNYSVITMVDGETHLISKHLKRVEAVFFRASLHASPPVLAH